MTEPLDERRVPDEEIEFDEDMIYFHNGIRFTGIGYEDSPVRGLSEISYRDGYQDGPSRDWYPSGVLQSEWMFRYNVREGISREFDIGGSLISEEFYEHGILVRSNKFDPDGSLVESFELSEDSLNFRLLQSYRAEWASRREGEST